MRMYGGAHLLNEFPVGIFTPSQPWPPREAVARIVNLPMVKNQGEKPVCTAVVAVTLYEQLLLREEQLSNVINAPLAMPKARASEEFSIVREEIGWAWTFLSGKELQQEGTAGRTIRPQLLAGMPLPAALSALCRRGVLTARETAHANDPLRLLEESEASEQRPKGTLVVPLRQVRLLPTRRSIFEAIDSQFAIAFAFAVDHRIDEWMHSRILQLESAYVCPAPNPGAPTLATHAAVIVGADLDAGRVTVQNSFGLSFGLDGFFFVPFELLLDESFTGLRFYILLRTA